MIRLLILVCFFLLPSVISGQPSESLVDEDNGLIINILRGVLGIASLIGITWLFSENKSSVKWTLIFKALGLQIILGFLILKVPFVSDIFDFLSKAFIKVISFSDYGADFLFGSFVSGEVESGLINFAFRILPTIVFFGALTSLFYYWGILQKVVYGLGWIMKKTLKLSGAESLAAAGNIFLGQTESPLLIRPYLGTMTKSEIMCLMTGGMATIAGGVLAAYIGFLGGDDPQQKLIFAKHLLTASLMSAPAAILCAKLLVPENEKYDDSMKIPKDKIGTNALEAIANGTTDGLKLAINVGAMLLVFTAFIYFGNYILFKFGSWTNINESIIANTNYNGLSFQMILGYIFAPIAWLIGVTSDDIVMVGQLLGEKTILNEFYAYKTLGEAKAAGNFTNQKSIIIATYILCGFANFASIGIQIGGIGALAPTRKGLLSKLGVKALIGGTVASLLTAAIVGMMI